ncbi:MAG: hypothetical protein A3G49_04360 [Candidatus Sungbacteria bacterium RIFCSPLOWO2_12_FULL_41_11]|uniref:Uncharacterized protein n=1 Tax=Candidatus Sungbacteria bacterium RIFCSPLOWO2_12_FULL_41_11 TaxID=1802286 RepID=A0A1G2LQ32_9BACT|nr:MAG: hypothetical protein UV01_C0001G0024 [Parcubacteria group bacterium GW2011_GWA2_42_14]OGZ97530.1 MAG: hypothetical protein A3D41_01450 [Candidatus Sungbacteria bacterium RIFCSPHIGHO2_02_FULL_41_12b]OHA12911.1 MAG: hypothetical protein A3G49_04360 [Candidatus Sungbacteria bacterium RIFCSPLOWO2_12_FULL_41_11]
MFFDSKNFGFVIKDYFVGFYAEPLGELFSRPTSLFGIVRLIFSPLLSVLLILAVIFTFTLILFVFFLPFFFCLVSSLKNSCSHDD